jgi:hypothetical protein
MLLNEVTQPPKKKKWTMPDGKTRSAAEGPWIASDDIRPFLAWLTTQGIEWREHPGLMSNGYQVRHDGHWMGLLWNKNWRRYTADRRLTLIVQSFAAEKAQAVERMQQPRPTLSLKR